MPGFNIDTRSDGSDENGKPHIELYISDGEPTSMIQKTAIEGINEYDTAVYDVSEEVGKVQSSQVQVTPTTIALDKDYEIERWESVTHADDIREVLDKW